MQVFLITIINYNTFNIYTMIIVIQVFPYNNYQLQYIGHYYFDNCYTGFPDNNYQLQHIGHYYFDNYYTGFS